MEQDVAAKIMALNMNGPRSVCVLSENGCISNVTVRNPTTSGGTVAYEGIFQILSLSGSFVPMEIDGYIFMTGGLRVSLSRLDHTVFGGSVVGSLVAATNVQVVVEPSYKMGTKTRINTEETWSPIHPHYLEKTQPRD